MAGTLYRAEWVKWYCLRCRCDVILENVLVDAKTLTFDVRCPLCDGLVRFVTPPKSALTGKEEYRLMRSSTEPVEVH